MNEAEQQPRVRQHRVEQKLQEVLKRGSDGKGVGDRVAGTSEETAELFSSGTTSAVRQTLDDSP
jgi:hypothetical protein